MLKNSSLKHLAILGLCLGSIGAVDLVVFTSTAEARAVCRVTSLRRQGGTVYSRVVCPRGVSRARAQDEANRAARAYARRLRR
jgi:hypothetical protein